MSVRYIPDILNGTGAAASFPTKAEFGDDYRLWSRPFPLDMGNFSNVKSRIYPFLQTIWSTHDLPDNERTRVHVIIRMQFLEFSYSNEKVEIKRIGSLDLYEYEYETDFYFENAHYTDTIGMVNYYSPVFVEK